MAALSGVHVSCHNGSSVPATSVQRPVIGKPIWSEQPASGTPTARTVPQDSGQFIFRVYATANVFVAIGKNPDPTNGTKVYVTAATIFDFEAVTGDKLAWVLDA